MKNKIIYSPLIIALLCLVQVQGTAQMREFELNPFVLPVDGALLGVSLSYYLQTSDLNSVGIKGFMMTDKWQDRYTYDFEGNTNYMDVSWVYRHRASKHKRRRFYLESGITIAYVIDKQTCRITNIGCVQRNDYSLLFGFVLGFKYDKLIAENTYFGVKLDVDFLRDPNSWGVDTWLKPMLSISYVWE